MNDYEIILMCYSYVINIYIIINKVEIIIVSTNHRAIYIIDNNNNRKLIYV